MAKRNHQADEALNEQRMTAEQSPGIEQPAAVEPSAASEPPSQPNDRLKYAQEKLLRMEEAQKLCLKHQNDFPLLAGELQKLKFNDYEISQLLEPKGPRTLPGYLKSEIERQKQYVHYLSARVKPPENHTTALEQSQSREDELAL